MESLSAISKIESLAAGAKICPADRESSAMFAAILRAMPEARPVAKAARRDWLNYVTVTQRNWQRRTRRPSRARHHDSIAIREKYVRC